MDDDSEWSIEETFLHTYMNNKSGEETREERIFEQGFLYGYHEGEKARSIEVNSGGYYTKIVSIVTVVQSIIILFLIL